jgi:hypothetical protein
MILLIGGHQRSGATLLRHLCDDLKLRMQVEAELRTVVEPRSGDVQRTDEPWACRRVAEARVIRSESE